MAALAILSTMSDLKKDYQYYVDNQDKLARQYAGKYLVIKDEAVVDAYDSEIDAYEAAKEKFELGTFLIKPCTPKGTDTVQVFHTRATL